MASIAAPSTPHWNAATLDAQPLLEYLGYRRCCDGAWFRPAPAFDRFARLPASWQRRVWDARTRGTTTGHVVDGVLALFGDVHLCHLWYGEAV